MPLLAAMLSAVGVLGGYLIGHGQFGVDPGVYWSSMQNGVDLVDDVLNGVIKSVVFGFIITWVALFEGYAAPPTSEGVSRAPRAPWWPRRWRCWAAITFSPR